MDNSAALPNGSSLTVGEGGTLLFDSPAAEPVVLGSSVYASLARDPVAVPEPGTLVLLLAGLAAGIGLARSSGRTVVRTHPGLVTLARKSAR